jgi:hypothetical protein
VGPPSSVWLIGATWRKPASYVLLRLLRAGWHLPHGKESSCA